MFWTRFKRTNKVNNDERTILDKTTSLVKKGEAGFYYFMVGLTVIGFTFILFSRQLFGDDSPIIDAGTGAKSVLSVGSSEVTIVEKTMNKKTGYGEIVIRVEQPVTQVGIEYQAIVGENSTKTLLQSKLTKIYDQYYLLQIEKVPPKWKQLVVDFGFTSKEKPQLSMNYLTDDVDELLKERKEKTEQGTFIFDYRKMKNSNELNARSENDYVISVTSIELENVEKLIKKANENRESFVKEITLLKNRIEELELSKEYETKEKIKQIDNEMKRVESEINSYEKAIVDIETQTKSLDEKKQKLIERNRKSTYETEESK